MNDFDFSKIGLKMKHLRIEQGVTQEKIAGDLGCTVSFVSNVENNRTKLNLRTLLYYAALCNVSVDSLLDAGKTSPTQINEDQQTDKELLHIFHTFSPDERKKMIKILKIWKSQ